MPRQESRGCRKHILQYIDVTDKVEAQSCFIAFGDAVQSKVYNFCGSEMPFANVEIVVTDDGTIQVVTSKAVAYNDEFMFDQKCLVYKDHLDNYDPPAVSILKVIARELTSEETKSIENLIVKAKENPNEVQFRVQFKGNILS